MTHHRLGVVGNAHAGGGQHFQVIGAVARGKHLVGAQAQLAAQLEQPVGLGLRVDDVALTMPVSRPLTTSRVLAMA